MDKQEEEKKEKVVAVPRKESIPKSVKFQPESDQPQKKGLYYNPDPEEENMRYDNLTHIKRGIHNPDMSTLPKIVFSIYYNLVIPRLDDYIELP